MLDGIEIGTTEATPRATTSAGILDLIRAAKKRAEDAMAAAPPTPGESRETTMGREVAQHIAAIDVETFAATMDVDAWHAVIPVALIDYGDPPIMVCQLVLVAPGATRTHTEFGDVTLPDFEALPTIEEARELRRASAA